MAAQKHLRIVGRRALAIAPEIIAQRGWLPLILFGGNCTRDKLREPGLRLISQIRDVFHADALVLAAIWLPDGSDGAAAIRPNNLRIFEGDNKLP